ncbi:MAG: glycosyltransferase family 4 protein [Actinomycetota bacterium]
MKIRVVFVTDVMQDVRMVEGFAGIFDLTVLAPRYLEERFITWPTNKPFERVFLPVGRARFVFQAAKWLRRNRGRFKVIIAQDNLTGALASNIGGRLTRTPVILRMGRTTEEYYRSKRHAGLKGLRYWIGLITVKALVGFNERAAASVGATSLYIADDCRKRARDVHVIPAYGVDLELFSAKVSRAEARTILDLPLDVSLIIWRSRLAPEKDPETYFRALALLGERGYQVNGLYVGAEYLEILRIAQPFGITMIARDAVHPKDLAHFYRAADVAVQTSRVEGFGLSPLEALACETPVVASRIGGLVETIIDGKTGITVAPNDPEATADAIAWMLDHPDDAAALARNGRQLIAERYTDEVAFGGWLALAQRLAAR